MHYLTPGSVLTHSNPPPPHLHNCSPLPTHAPLYPHYKRPPLPPNIGSATTKTLLLPNTPQPPPKCSFPTQISLNPHYNFSPPAKTQSPPPQLSPPNTPARPPPQLKKLFCKSLSKS
ncbi:hypothetical protein M8J76_001115 [Diaphorina citri]|nr:hypothetical protein M8J75_009331 [Diaphorina citri]KAI5716111.1 hypothetical protein M8J76_001115 [Diaphorina citri]